MPVRATSVAVASVCIAALLPFTGRAEQLNQQRFYAHLYVGLFYDITGRADLARTHLHEAVKHRIDHYMWEVARVQADMLDKRPP